MSPSLHHVSKKWWSRVFFKRHESQLKSQKDVCCFDLRRRNKLQPLHARHDLARWGQPPKDVRQDVTCVWSIQISNLSHLLSFPLLRATMSTIVSPTDLATIYMLCHHLILYTQTPSVFPSQQPASNQQEMQRHH